MKVRIYHMMVLVDDESATVRFTPRNRLGRAVLEPVHNLAVPRLNMQVFEQKTSRSTKRNSITMSARRSFGARNRAFEAGGRL